MSASQSIDLKKVAIINQKYKDIVFGFTRAAQSVFPGDNPYFNIVDLIKYLCLLYYYNLFDSKILTDKEKDDFFQLLSKNNKDFDDYQWNLLYRASRDGLNRDLFVNKVHGKPNVICFIEIEGGNVCGGYTSTGWTKGAEYYTHSKDSKAFIFGIRSSKDYAAMIRNVKKNDKNGEALYYFYDGYCWFGDAALCVYTDGNCYALFH